MRSKISFSLNKSERSIIVASTGRAGSTLLYKTILDGYVRSRWGSLVSRIAGTMLYKVHGAFIARVDTMVAPSPVVIKTHDLFPSRGLRGAKCVFLYGDPLESALSVDAVVRKKGIEWFKQHQYNLRAQGEYSDLFERDVLNYVGQIKSWLSQKNEDVMVLSYEEIWSKQLELEKFLGFSIVLPPRRDRGHKQPPQNVNEQLFDDMKRLTYEHKD